MAKRGNSVRASKPMVSIVTPAYNASEYISETIESIQKQTFANYEHIIIDDGSTDDTISKASTYAKKDHRIKIIKQKNSGAAAARNKGIDIAEGEFVTFVDSDDFIVDDMLEVLVESARKNNNDVICFDKYLYNNSSSTLIKETWLYKTDSLPEVFAPTKDISNFTFTFAPLCICVFLSKRFLDEHQLRFDIQYRRNEDILFLGKVMALASRASVVKKELYYYRIGMDQNMTSTLDKYIDDGWRTLQDLHDFLVDRKLLKGNVKASFDILSCAILWHYIHHMKTYEGQKYAFTQSKIIAKKLKLDSMEDPGDIYREINFYEDFQAILGGTYDEYLWSNTQRDKKHIGVLTDRVNDLDKAMTEKDTELSKLSSKLSGVYNSRSWKITEPLRATGRAGHRIRSSLRSK